jgi:polyhydroxyalkanoate synthase
MMPFPRSLRAAAANLSRLLLYGHVADLRPMPAEPVEPAEPADEGPRGTLYRYRPPGAVIPAGPPVLFVPPPAATTCGAAAAWPSTW